jgi:hypothetical protein
MARKILTITCHNVYNHGATLQQLALLKQLEAMGFDAATLDYSPNYLNQHFKWTKVSNAFFAKNVFLKAVYWVLKFPSNLWNRQRKWRFDAFESKTLRIHPVKYTCNEALKTNLPDADAYICGSDQIWNSYFQNGKDPAFYLDFVPANKLKIYTIGVGADEMIVRSFFGSRKVNPSADLDENTLVKVAESTGGRYFRARNADELENIYMLLDRLEPVEKDKQYFRPRSELYYWPLSLALALAAFICLSRLRST